MSKYEHVNESSHKYFSLSDEERMIACTNDFWVNRPSAEEIINHIRLLMKMRGKQNAPCLLVTAPGGAGKTALIEELKRRNSRNEEKMIFVTMHQSPNGYSLKELILSELGVGVGRYARRGRNIAPEMQQIIASKNIRAIVIDEIHDALTLSENQQRINLSLLKNLSGTAYNLSVFAFGIREAASVLRQDPQLERRYTIREIPDWKCDDEFRNFVSTYIHHLPLKNKTDYNDQRLIVKLMAQGRGVTDNIVKILQTCAMASILDKSERIDHRQIDDIDNIMANFAFSLQIGDWRSVEDDE